MKDTNRRRHRLKASILCLALFTAVAVAPLAHGETELHALPPILSTLSDEAGVLTIPEGQRLATMLADIEKEAGVPVIVVILTTVRPESMEAYVGRLIDRWRHESKRLDHGRFVFVAVAKEDREVRIVPSKPLAWVLRPLTQSEVAVQAPALLKQNKYFEALTAIAEKLSHLFAEHDDTAPRKAKTQRFF